MTLGDLLIQAAKNPLSLPKQEKSSHTAYSLAGMPDAGEDSCLECNGTGFVLVDIGGGNSCKRFCLCPKGDELFEKDIKARDHD